MVRNYVKDFDIDISNCNVSEDVFNEEVDYQIRHVCECDLVSYYEDGYYDKVAKLAIQCALFQFYQTLSDIQESQKQL